MDETLTPVITWIDRYWKLLSFLVWMGLAIVLLFGDNRYQTKEEYAADTREIKTRIAALELNYATISAQLNAINANQLRILQKLNSP